MLHLIHGDKKTELTETGLNALPPDFWRLIAARDSLLLESRILSEQLVVRREQSRKALHKSSTVSLALGIVTMLYVTKLGFELGCMECIALSSVDPLADMGLLGWTAS